MHIAVFMFGPARDLAGGDQLIIEVPERARIETVRNALATVCPRIAPALSTMRIAVNQSFASDDREVGADDEVALIPPVSGG